MPDILFKRRAILKGGLTLAATSIAAAPLRAQGGRFPAYGKVERLDPALDALIDANAIVEEVAGGFAWAEGPVWVGGADGMILVSDPRQNFILAWNERNGASRWLQPSGFDGSDPGLFEPGSNGLFLASGRSALVVADSGNRRVGRIDLQTKEKSTIVDRFEGKRFNSPNDVCLSPLDKAIYFTDPPYGLKGGADSPLRELDFTGVFRVDGAGKVTLIERDMRPNGIGLSPDGRTLYHTDNSEGWIAHQLDDEGRSIKKRVFIDRAAEGMTGGGDGFKVDRAGNLWLTSRDGISIVTAEGRRIGIIRLNGPCANCEIGADGYLYIASGVNLARVKVKAQKLGIA